MDNCVWTTLARFAAKSKLSESAQLVGAKPNHELFDRMCNVYGWSSMLCVTTQARTAQRVEFSLTSKDLRRAGGICCMNRTFKHQCGSFKHTEVVSGEYEVAIKLAKWRHMRFLQYIGRYLLPNAQIEVDGASGDDTTEHHDAENTEVVQDTATETNIQNVDVEDDLQVISSTEKLYTFESILNRYIPLKQIVVTTSSLGLVAQYKLPHDLYTVACVSNTLPLEQMMYGDFDIEVMVKPNAQKFQAGLGFVSVLLDSAGLEDAYSTDWQQAMQRPSAWFDVAGTTAAKLNLPFEYRKTFVRNLAHGQNAAGVEGGIYVTLQIFMAAELNVAAGNDTQFQLLPFIKITRARFAGMTYKVPVAQGPIGAIRKFADFIKEHDAVLETISDFTGLDKPAAVENVSVVCPIPRLHFPNAKGLSDATVLRLNPAAVTSMPKRCRESIKHNSIYDIARTWGHLGNFAWSENDAQGKMLFSFPLESANFANLMDSSTTFNHVHPPPISAIARMYQLETGTREMRIRFASTGFHSGSITINMEYGRTSGNDDICQPYASYYITFDLGETKEFETVIPYIFDTPWRRCGTIPLFGHQGWNKTGDTKTYRTGLIQNVNTRVVVRVANALRASNTVTTQIKALVFVRAGVDWRVMGPVMNNGMFVADIDLNYNFPSDRFPRSAKTEDLKYPTTGVVKLESDRKKTLSDVLRAARSAKETQSFLTTLKKKRYVDLNTYMALQTQLKNEQDQVTKLKDLETACQDKLLLETQRAESVDNERTQMEYSVLTAYTALLRQYGLRNTNLSPSELKLSSYDGKPREDMQYVKNGKRYLLMQETTYPKHQWVYAKSGHWSRMLQAGGLLPTFKWEVKDEPVPPVEEVPKSQGLGDMTIGPTKFEANTLEPTMTLASSESDSIWDALKRPVCLTYQREVAMYKIPTTDVDGGHNPWLWPIVPPQLLYCRGQVVEGVDHRLFDPLLIQSPHVAYTSMFRWFRGTQRYTIVWYGSKPLYIQYLPKSGTRFCGEYTLCRSGVDAPYPNSCTVSSGLITEMLVPSVNPVAHIEVPYISENQWTPLNSYRSDANWHWRDKGDDTLGHLALIASEKANVDIWWAAGNDFRMGGFLGCLYQDRYRLVDTYDDDAPRAQADFRLEEGAPERGLPSAQMWAIAGAIGTAVGSMYTTYNINKTVNTAAQILPKIEKSSELLTEGLMKHNDIISELHNLVVGDQSKMSSLVDKIVSVSEGILGKLDNAQVAVSLLLDVFMVWKVPDVTVIATTLVRWFVQSGIVGAAHLIRLVNVTSEYLKDLFTPRAQAFEGTMSSLVAFVEALVVASGYIKNVGSTVVSSVVEFIANSCDLRSMVQLGRTIDCFHRFVTGIVSLVKMIWYYFVGKVDPDAKVYTLLTEKNETFLNFVAEAQRFLQVGVRETLKVSPSERLRFYATVQLSYLIQKVFIKNQEIKASIPLLQMINKLQKMADEVGADLLSSPVRYEPYVLCLYGDTGIGKSFLSTDLVKQLLSNINWVGGSEPIYIRTPGQEFWNGYVNQPVVIFDDINNINETQANVATIADIFALKSSAAFNPNMARLDEKDRRGNPLLVITLTNKPFPCLNESAYPEAYFRRRDAMFRVVADPSKPKDETFQHLSFAEYTKLVPTCTKPEGEVSQNTMSYTTFLEVLKEKHKAYHQKEVSNVRYRWQNLVKSMKSESEQTLFDYDPYGVMTRHLFSAEMAMPGGQERVVEEMGKCFGRYCDSHGCDDVVGFFEEKHLSKFKEAGVSAQAYEEMPKRRPNQNQHEYEKEREDWIKKHLNDERTFLECWIQWFGKSRTDQDFRIVTKMILDSIMYFRTQDFLEMVVNKTGYAIGTCSHCERTHELLIRRCMESGTPLCESGCQAGWCFTCINTGKVRHGDYPQALGVPENYSIVIGCMVACIHAIAKACVIPVRFVGFLLIRVMSNYTVMLESIGCGAILNSLVCFLGGNFVGGLKCATAGFWLLFIRERCPTLGDDLQLSEVIKAISVQVFNCVAIPYKAIKNLILQLYPATETEAEPDVAWMDEPRSQAQENYCVTVDIPYMPYVKSFKYQTDWACCQHYDLFNIAVASTSAITPISELVPVVRDPVTQEVMWPTDIDYAVDSSVMYVAGGWDFCWEGNRIKIENRPCCDVCILRNPKAIESLLQACVVNESWFMQAYRAALSDRTEIPVLPYQLFTPDYVAEVYEKETGWFNQLYQDIKSYVLSDWWTWLKTKIGSVMSTCGSWLIIISFGAAVIYKVYEYTSNFMAAWNTEATSESPPEGRPKFARKLNRRVGKAQASDENVTNISNVVMSNQFTMNIARANGTEVKLGGLGVAKHIAIMPRHYWPIIVEAIENKSVVTVAKLLDPGRVWPVKVEIVDFKVDLSNDFMSWEVPKQLGIWKDIRKHFAPCSFYETNSICDEGFMVIPPIRNNPLPTIQPLRLKERLDQQTVRGLRDELYDIVDVITYNFSLAGACGSPVYRCSSVSPIIGIHVAGRGEGVRGTGYCPIVTRESLDELMGPGPVLDVRPQSLGSMEESLLDFDDHILVHELGTVPENMMVVQPMHTKIVKTVIADDLKIVPERIPAPLAPNDPPYAGLQTTPLFEGVKHHGEPWGDIGTRAERQMELDLDNEFYTILPTVVGPAKLTDQEAIVGKPGLEYYDSIDLQTSAGWPWNKQAEDTTKQAWLEFETDASGRAVSATINPQLQEVLDSRYEERRAGIIQDTVFVDCMKDEKKDRVKLGKLGKTRIFCVSPVDLTIAVRRYYLHFIAAFMMYRLKIPSAVGIAPDSFEWGMLIDSLHRVNPIHCWSIDYKNFGPGFSIRAASAMFNAMKKWIKRHVKGMDEEDYVAMDCIKYEHTNSMHLCRNEIYQQGCGSPSGSAATVIENTGVNIGFVKKAVRAILFDYWKKTHYKKSGGSYDTPGEETGFWEWVKKVFVYYGYGDDICAASAEEIIHLLNAKTICEYFAHFGITATDNSKGLEVEPYVTYDKFEFLKRGCTPHPFIDGEWLAPVKWSVVQEAAYYTWKSEDIRHSTRENAMASAVLAYGHGPEKFEAWMEVVNSCLADRQIPVITVTWYDLDALFYPVKGEGVSLYKHPQWTMLVNDGWSEEVDVSGILDKVKEVDAFNMQRYVQDCEEKILPAPLKRKIGNWIPLKHELKDYADHWKYPPLP